MKTKLILGLIILIFFQVSFSQRKVYKRDYLDSLYQAVLVQEIDNYSPYLEYGLLQIGTEDSTSYYISKKEANGRFRITEDLEETGLNDTIDLLFENKPITLYDFSSNSYHNLRPGYNYLFGNAHLMNYIKIQGRLIILVNGRINFDKVPIVETGLKSVDAYLVACFEQISEYRKAEEKKRQYVIESESFSRERADMVIDSLLLIEDSLRSNYILRPPLSFKVTYVINDENRSQVLRQAEKMSKYLRRRTNKSVRVSKILDPSTKEDYIVISWY